MKSLKKLFSFKGLFAIFALAISFQIISPEIAFAEQNDTLQGLAELLGVLISVLTFISLLMMNFFGQLLGTNLLTGPEAMQALTPMWVWVRNLTNILFVLVLVGLAFSNLFASFSGEGGGNWTIKEKLPKVIIALVAINFSLLGFKVVIDAVNVGTVAILGIADSRLDADNPEQENAMISDKTWTIVSKNLYDKMDTVEFKEGQNKISGGSSCTSENKEANLEPGQVLGIIKPDSKDKPRHYICRSFRSQVNDLFCSNWEKMPGLNENEKDNKYEYPEQGALGDDCLFLLKKDTFNTILSPKDEPGQNLFMSFGTTFMHLERLPALGAQINSLNGVIMNTLFSSILGIAYIVALIAIFIALIARVIVIWIALVFSPLLIAASIMGFGDGKAGEATEKLITHLIMPLKIAAAFAVSFVMMSGMVEFNTVGKNDAFLFGPALSNLGIAEYGFMWQMATIVIFWMAAQWATEGNLAHSITEKIFTGAQSLGEVAARAATIDRQIFSVGTGESGKKFSMSSVMRMPEAIEQAHRQTNLDSFKNMQDQLGFTRNQALEKIKETKYTTANALNKDTIKFSSEAEAKANLPHIIAAIRRSDIITSEKDKMIEAAEKGWDSYVEYMKKKGGKDRDAINLKDSNIYGSSGTTPTDPAKTEEKPVADIVGEKDGHTTVSEQKLSDLKSFNDWTSKGNAISLSATNYGEIAEKENEKNNPAYLSALFKTSTTANKSAKIITEITDYIATVNTGGDNGVVSLAESKNGAVKAILVNPNGKTPITNLFGQTADQDTKQFTINNSFITAVKEKVDKKESFNNDEIEMLKILKKLEAKKFISNNNTSNAITEDNKTFITNLTIPAPTN